MAERTNTPTRSPKVEALIRWLIVREGLSYQAAIRRCEQLAAPYLEAAEEIRSWTAGDG